MPTSIAIGFSQAEDPKDAAHQACVLVKNQLNSITTDMVIIFASIHYCSKEVLSVIHTILKPARLVGSSSASIIFSEDIYKRGLAILAINSQDLNFAVASTSYHPGDPLDQIGFEFGRKINADYKSSITRQASIIFCDGLSLYDDQLLRGMKELLGRSLLIAGAFSCDDFKLKRTFQFYQQDLLSKSVVGFLFGSNSAVAFSNKHGFRPLGKPRTITRVEGTVIQTIDHKPAISIYEEFLKDDAKNLKKGLLKSSIDHYPLGIYLEDQQQYLLRYPVDILNDGSIVCQASVPLNSEVHLTISNKDSCKNAAAEAAQEIKMALAGRQPQILIVFESMVRHRTLSQYSFIEIQTIKEILGYSTPLIGMSSFGELCPAGLDENKTNLQNGSISLLAIC